MSDIKLKMDLAGFKEFGKKSITCENEQIGQLCWNGDISSPVMIDGKTEGSPTRCSVGWKESLSCFEAGMIPIGIIHTHPSSVQVDLDPRKDNEKDITSFSSLDVYTAMREDKGMGSSLVSCLASRDSTACISFNPRKEGMAKRLVLDVYVLDAKMQMDKEVINKMLNAPIPKNIEERDELVKKAKRLSKKLGEDSKELYEMVATILKEHFTSTKFNHDRKTIPTITINSQKVFSTINRYGDFIKDWKKDESRLKSIASGKVAGIETEEVTNAKYQLKYIEHGNVLMDVKKRMEASMKKVEA